MTLALNLNFIKNLKANKYLTGILKYSLKYFKIISSYAAYSILFLQLVCIFNDNTVIYACNINYNKFIQLGFILGITLKCEV